MDRSSVVRFAIFLATVVASWAVLSIGTVATTDVPEVGKPAPQDYLADNEDSVVDEVETELQRQAARDEVVPPRARDAEIESTVLAGVQAVFDDLQALAIGDPPPGSEPTIPELPPVETTTTTQGDGSTTTTQPPDDAVVTGFVYIDVDGDSVLSLEGPGVPNPDTGEIRLDTGLADITVTATTNEGTQTVTTGDDGLWTLTYPGGPIVIAVDVEDTDIPEGYFLSTDNGGQLVECDPGDLCSSENIGFGVNLRPFTEVIDAVQATHDLPDETVIFLAGKAADDVVRNALGEVLHLPDIAEAAVTEATVQLSANIVPEDLQAARASVRSSPPLVFHPDSLQDEEGGMAAAEVVATNLQPNFLIDQEEYQRLQTAAAERVEPVVVTYDAGSLIVAQGVQVTELHTAAIQATAAPSIEEQPSTGLLAVMIVLVGLTGFYLARFRPEFWARPRMVALLGILIVLASAAVRGTVALQDISWYVMPAVAFGFVTAVLFDQRIAILMALSVGVLTAVGTLDTGVTVYATLAAMAPIPFVSSVSSRGSFRNAVILSSLVAAAIAAATSWFFIVPGPDESLIELVGVSVAWAFGVSMLSSLIGLAALQFFESAFDVTTTLSLLDLTDRNHEALQMLQEKAFGTFNHSLMVGTLADAAAKSIGANNLLARAMAYYHDLGKTENPSFFIENQFGIPNPHDALSPAESAAVLRNHVTDGVALARKYKIPTEVTEGIVSHHGDGVMRYFYEKARSLEGEDVNIDDFRHVGHKPRTAESAILMLADSLEAACRAEFQNHEPTPEHIEKMVNKIMDEKLEDGQLNDSPLTLGELTTVRKAFLDSLVGHYHQRITYPNFPGS